VRIAFITIASTSTGTALFRPGARPGGAGSPDRIAWPTASGAAEAGNGRTPLTSSYSTTPSCQTSLAVLSGSLRICSGLA